MRSPEAGVEDKDALPSCSDIKDDNTLLRERMYHTYTKKEDASCWFQVDWGYPHVFRVIRDYCISYAKGGCHPDSSTICRISTTNQEQKRLVIYAVTGKPSCPLQFPQLSKSTYSLHLSKREVCHSLFPSE